MLASIAFAAVREKSSGNESVSCHVCLYSLSDSYIVVSGYIVEIELEFCEADLQYHKWIWPALSGMISRVEAAMASSVYTWFVGSIEQIHRCLGGLPGNIPGTNIWERIPNLTNLYSKLSLTYRGFVVCTCMRSGSDMSFELLMMKPLTELMMVVDVCLWNILSTKLMFHCRLF